MTVAGRPGVSRVRSDLLPSPFPTLRLSAVAAAVDGATIHGAGDAPVADASFDTREVAPGSLFFCVRGSALDGHDLAGEALAAGAVALVVERVLDVAAPQVLVPSVRAAMGPMSAVLFGRPADALTTIGITGTNGKTTVTYLVESILRSAGRVPGAIGTTGARIDRVPEPLARTTPEAPDLHRLLAVMRRRGVDAVAIEVSSHALAQDRVAGLRFDVAAFTNLSQDHLDFHDDMEAYFRAKASLFVPERAASAAIGIDDDHGRRLAAQASVGGVTYGLSADADVRATDVDADASGISFVVGGAPFRSSLRGRFNVHNCLCALSIARLAGVDDSAAAAGIGALAGVPGRFEAVDVGQEFLVVVDYAHTPDSIQTVLAAARDVASGRVIAVFGCGGDRDRAKRPLMGAAATSEADLTIITTDNPRSEDPLAIVAEVERGARSTGGAYVVEPDRRAAISEAVRAAAPGDAVVIAGRGHEPMQTFADRTVPFDDRVVAAEELRSARADR
jgi:UDP-N-acetylmuramoyl-L-alanyl-D-glutamate--2,6-diaminopimelate ligase